MAEREKLPIRSRIWKWIRRGIVTVFLFLVLLGCAMAVYITWANHRGEQDLRAALRQIRSRGLPTSRQEIYEEAGPADAAATHLYSAALELARARPPDYDELPYVGSEGPPLRKPLDVRLVAKLSAFAKDNERYFALLDEARSKHARIPLLEFHALGQPNLAPVSQAQGMAKDWLLISLLAQAERKPAEAVRACRNTIALNRMFDGQPLIIIGLMRVALETLARSGAEATLSRTAPRAEDLRDLQAALLAEDAAFDLQEMVKGELAFMAEVAADPALMDIAKAREIYNAMCAQRSAEEAGRKMSRIFAEAGVSGTGPDLTSYGIGTTVSRRRLRAYLVISWTWHCVCPGATKWLHAWEMNRAIEDYEAAGAAPDELARRAKRLMDEDKDDGFTLNPPTIQYLLRGKAELRVAAAAIEVELYRIAHGRWPQKMADVDASVPTDPFTGKPMRYKRVDEGCVIYSVGPNLEDDGGQGNSEDADDVRFRLFNVGKRNKP